MTGTTFLCVCICVCVCGWVCACVGVCVEVGGAAQTEVIYRETAASHC